MFNKSSFVRPFNRGLPVSISNFLIHVIRCVKADGGGFEASESNNLEYRQHQGVQEVMVTKIV
jgi:hypothetical protein